MLQAIRRFFDARIRPASGVSGTGADDHALRLATAALLIETARADFREHEHERRAVEAHVRRTFGLSEAETRELVSLAEREADESTSLYQFTSLINRHFPPERKREIVELMWRVAFADGHMDKYEEHLVRKVADLLHVSHRDFIRAKHRAAADADRTDG